MGRWRSHRTSAVSDDVSYWPRVVFESPVDSLCPPRVEMDIEEALDNVWRSPNGNYCFGWSYMDEVGGTHWTILAYRSMEGTQ